MYWDASKANLEGADSYSRKALELNPDQAEAHASRGLAVSLSKRYEEAEQEFATAIRLNPKLYEAHYFFGRATQQQGKYEEAIRHFEEASRVRPEDYQSAMLASLPYEGLGRHAEGHASLRRGLLLAEKHRELNPDDVRALYLAGIALIQLGERERAWNSPPGARHRFRRFRRTLQRRVCLRPLEPAGRGVRVPRQGDHQRLRSPRVAGERFRPRQPPYGSRFEALLKRL
jgi:tetratricopeptide (TPR) repeat protein